MKSLACDHSWWTLISSCRITYCHLPFQSKWLYIGSERGNIHIVNVESFTLSGYVIMWNKAIELWVCFPPLPFLLTGSLHYLLSCPGPVYTHPGIYEKQTNVSAETVCPVHWEDCGSASAKLGLYSLNDWKWGCLILFCLLFVLKWNKRWTYN